MSGFGIDGGRSTGAALVNRDIEQSEFGKEVFVSQALAPAFRTHAGGAYVPTLVVGMYAPV